MACGLLRFSDEYYLVGIVLSLGNLPTFQKEPTAYIFKVVPGIWLRHRETLLQIVIVKIMGEKLIIMAEISFADHPIFQEMVQIHEA
jgi:hypothetical protein